MLSALTGRNAGGGGQNAVIWAVVVEYGVCICAQLQPRPTDGLLLC